MSTHLRRSPRKSKSPQRKEAFSTRSETPIERSPKKDEEKVFMDSLVEWSEWITYEMPPGPPIIPQWVYCDLHKGGMPLLLLAQMFYFENFSKGAYLYFALHGSYGFFWCLKDFTFPDKSFLRKCTISSFLMPWPVALIPYSYPGYLMMSGQVD